MKLSFDIDSKNKFDTGYLLTNQIFKLLTKSGYDPAEMLHFFCICISILHCTITDGDTNLEEIDKTLNIMGQSIKDSILEVCKAKENLEGKIQ